MAKLQNVEAIKNPRQSVQVTASKTIPLLSSLPLILQLLVICFIIPVFLRFLKVLC